MSAEHFSIGLFYGSTTCYTEMAAEKIQAQLNELFADDVVSIHNIKDTDLRQSENYDILIFGISTWDFGELQEDWASHWDDAAALDLNGKTVALYGLGDQEGYPDWYQDALGMLHDIIAPSGCRVIGMTSIQGHTFNASKALTADRQQFVGLALDDETQFDQTDTRIADWCEQLLTELSE